MTAAGLKFVSHMWAHTTWRSHFENAISPARHKCRISIEPFCWGESKASNQPGRTFDLLLTFLVTGSDERVDVVDAWEGCPDSMQGLVKAVKGLRVAPPESAEQGKSSHDTDILIKQLVIRGFNMQVSLPTCLHSDVAQLKTLSDKTQIAINSTEDWSKLISMWPGTLEGIMARLVESLFVLLRSPIFVTRQHALHGLFEIASLSNTSGISSIFSGEQLVQLLSVLSHSYRKNDVGLPTGAVCIAGSLWNMIANNRAMIRMPGEDSVPSSPMGLRDDRQILNFLLRNGLIKTCCDVVNDSSSLGERKMCIEYRSGQ